MTQHINVELLISYVFNPNSHSETGDGGRSAVVSWVQRTNMANMANARPPVSVWRWFAAVLTTWSRAVGHRQKKRRKSRLAGKLANDAISWRHVRVAAVHRIRKQNRWRLRGFCVSLSRYRAIFSFIKMRDVIKINISCYYWSNKIFIWNNFTLRIT